MATVLQADSRESFKGSKLTNLRQAGNIPAVVYGKLFGNRPVAVEEKAFIKTLRSEGKTGVIKLDLDGKQTDVMIYDMQYDTIKNQIVHVDFYAVDMKVEMDADVPVQIIGESIGVKDGGVLQQAVYELSVRALPANLPDSIEVDVSALDVNDAILVKDLTSGAQYEFNSEPEEVVISILAPTEEPEEPETPDEDAEPELVGDQEDAEKE